MIRAFISLSALLLIPGVLTAAEISQTVFEKDREILYLDGLGVASRWGPSEATVTDAEGKYRSRGRPTLHFHIDVDFHAGEKKYPIGWPRMYAKLIPGPETRWRDYDRFEFDLYTRMSRKEPPKKALNFQMHCPAKPAVSYHNCTELRLDRWVTVSLPVADIANVAQIARLGFNISESDYRDKDVLDFYIGAFRLVRSAHCNVTAMTIRTPAIFPDHGVVPVELVVAGPPENVSRGIPMTLFRGQRVLRRETLPARRGRQIMPVDVSELRLVPGTYRLVLFEGDPKREISRSFRVVESPWKE